MRTTFDRDCYRPRPSEGCENLRVRTYPDLPGTEIWTYECDNGGNYVAAFGGKRAKPDFHERYRDPENREHRISEYLKGARMRAERVAKDRAERYEPHGFEPGQLFYASWGYDQTNIDYYRLEKLKGKTMGYIVPVTSCYVEDDGTDPAGPAQLKVKPGGAIREWDVLLGVEKGGKEPGKWKRLTKDGFTVSHAHAGPCSPETVRYETHPMFGH
jgi:hypothetical protein